MGGYTITIKLKKNNSFFTKALFQVRSLVRNVRSAEPGKDNKKGKGKKGKGKGKGKKGKGRKAEKGKGNKKGKKNGNKKNGARKGGNRGKGKGGNKKKGGKGNRARNNQKKGKSGKKNGKKGDKKNKDSDSNKKKGRSGKDLKLLPEFLYNQLWCFDLAMEQVFKLFDNNLVVFMPDIWQHISDVFLIVDNVCRL